MKCSKMKTQFNPFVLSMKALVWLDFIFTFQEHESTVQCSWERRISWSKAFHQKCVCQGKYCKISLLDIPMATFPFPSSTKTALPNFYPFSIKNVICRFIRISMQQPWIHARDCNNTRKRKCIQNRHIPITWLKPVRFSKLRYRSLEVIITTCLFYKFYLTRNTWLNTALALFFKESPDCDGIDSSLS